MRATEVVLRSPASTGGAPVPTDITQPGQDPAFGGRGLTIRGDPGHRVHRDLAVQEGLTTSMQMLIQAARVLPPALPQFPEVIGYITTPEIPGWPARTFTVIKFDDELGREYEVNFVHLGPLLSQHEMATRVWESSPTEARLLRTWWWLFGRFWYRRYYETPGLARAVDREHELAVIAHDCARLRREMGRPGGDEGNREGLIDEAMLSPRSRAAFRYRMAQLEGNQAGQASVDPALLEPEVQIIEE